MKALKDFRVVTLCPHCHGEILFTVDVKKNGGIAWNVYWYDRKQRVFHRSNGTRNKKNYSLRSWRDTMKIKIPIRITTTISHTDNPKVPIQYLAGRYRETEIEIDIPDESVNIFRQLWMTNELIITVHGEKKFHDGEEIA